MLFFGNEHFRKQAISTQNQHHHISRLLSFPTSYFTTCIIYNKKNGFSPSKTLIFHWSESCLTNPFTTWSGGHWRTSTRFQNSGRSVLPGVSYLAALLLRSYPLRKTFVTQGTTQISTDGSVQVNFYVPLHLYWNRCFPTPGRNKI